jgi:glycerol uptake facilitator-like aquaporin
VTLARALTDTFSGIRPSDVPGFIIAEMAGAVAAILVFRWILPKACRDVGEVKPLPSR